MTDENLQKVSKLDKNRYIEVIGITDYESNIRFQKFKMTDPIWRTKIHKVSKLDENRYTGVFEVTDYETIIRFVKFKIADPIFLCKLHLASKCYSASV